MSTGSVRRFLFPLLVALIGASTSCSKAKLGCGSDSERAALIKAVDDALSGQDCAKAIETVEPFYDDPGCANDEYRYARASSYACAAGINFFNLISDLGSATTTGNGLWETFTELFPSTFEDGRVTAAKYTLDTLYAIRTPGLVTPSQYLINVGHHHEGTILASNRTDESNIYGIFGTMSLIGSLQNRYGAPDASYQKTQALGRTPSNVNGWMNATAVTEDACAYAGALLTFVDDIIDVGAQLSSVTGDTLGNNLSNEAVVYNILFNAACEAGCSGSNGFSTCNFPAGTCTTCPTTLRNRNSCNGAAKNVEACAAAGLAHFINTSALGWQGPL